MDSLQDTAELGRGVCGVSGRIYVRKIKNTAQQGREQSGTNNPFNAKLREGDAPGAQAETTVEQIFTPQIMGNPTLEQVGKFLKEVAAWQFPHWSRKGLQPVKRVHASAEEKV